MPRGGPIGIWVDGRRVGAATRVRTDAARRKLGLEGLDALARLFFASTGELAVGDVAICAPDGDRTRWVMVSAASVYSFSSGTGDIVLMGASLRASDRAPLAAVQPG